MMHGDVPQRAIEVSVDGPVAHIGLRSPRDSSTGGDLHRELGAAMSRLRLDDSIRVVCVTGTVPGEFLVPRPASSYAADEGRRSRTDPALMWSTFQGLTILHETFAQIEKPIVAKVNGDAVGFGASLMFACDLIVAREDAMVVDTHMGMGEFGDVGPADFALVPGDGGATLVPLYMSPALAKEFLMLSKPYTARELADKGVINAAVDASVLDDTVAGMIDRLLARSAYALAWSKRLVNHRVRAAVAGSLDAGLAYEMVNFHQWERMGWSASDALGHGDGHGPGEDVGPDE